MNRNERRALEKAQEKSQKKSGALRPAVSATPAAQSKAEQLKTDGMALKAEGKEAEAVPLLTKALELDSSLADVHFTLAILFRTKPDLKIDMENVNRGIKDRKVLKDAYLKISYILSSRKQYKESLICQEEICRLFPEDNDEKVNLAVLLNLANKTELALKILAELMRQEPDNKTHKSTFINMCGPVAYRGFEPVIKEALQTCFANIYETNLRKAYSPWINTVMHDPACAGIGKAGLLVTEDDFNAWASTVKDDDLCFVNEPFFLDGLRLLILSDPVFETFLIRMRRWICLNAERLSKSGRLDFFRNFLFALGEQCFFNEYIYSVSKAEKDTVDRLIGEIKANTPTAIDILAKYAIVSCYYTLFETFPDHEKNINALADTCEGFKKLAKTQFFDMQQERNLRKNLKAFGTLENEVSKNVRAQYEENPYPRWISSINYPTANDSLPTTAKDRDTPRMVLIAGCGTGRHAIGGAVAFPKAKITAIDLSRASLAYGQRKAIEAGLDDRIDFIHADILSMEKWPEQFDIIESSGVLHHMEDPFRGWQVLTGILKPGGYFKIGLYSEIARKQIVAARKYVTEHGFSSTLEGIRACRDSIMALPVNTPMRQPLVASADFYATSVVRDLIFHVQEHRMTLPQIQDMMDRLGLVCTRFVVSNAETLVRFDAMFPEDKERCNLGNWHKFEEKHPDTFLGMYQFWCQKV
jgi:ubiquinone/menaquinone biosynthesis C-methylase UbiE